MLDLFLAPGLQPFLISGGLVIGLCLLEVIFLLAGISTEIEGQDPGGDLDTDLGSGFEADTGPSLDPRIEAALANSGLDASALEGVEGSEAPSHTAAAGASASVIDFLGLRGLPMTVWLAVLAAFFAGIGLAGQSLIMAILGTTLPASLAAILAILPAIIMTRLVAGFLSRMIPREESTAISTRNYGRRRGVVTVGTARRGKPAQVRFTDYHGNMHHLMAEPLADEDEIEAGSEVLVLRMRDGRLRLVQIG